MQLHVVAADGRNGVNQIVDIQCCFKFEVLRVDDVQRFFDGFVFKVACRELQAGTGKAEADTVVAIKQQHFGALQRVKEGLSRDEDRVFLRRRQDLFVIGKVTVNK